MTYKTRRILEYSGVLVLESVFVLLIGWWSLIVFASQAVLIVSVWRHLQRRDARQEKLRQELLADSKNNPKNYVFRQDFKESPWKRAIESATPPS